MASRFMTDPPHAMRDMAGRFEVHAQTVEDEARRMWASAQNISGAGWSGMWPPRRPRGDLARHHD